MQDNEKKPALRFKGFTDPWEQRKLGDITVELSEYATQELGLPLLTSSRSGLMYQDEYRDSRTTKSTETLFSVVPVGTCTYRHMSDDDVFHMNINTLEKGLVSREYPVFEASKGNNLEFLVQHINSSEEFKAFCAEQKKGGTRTRLYYNTLCQFTVRVPALKEQAQISQCLKKLDTLITLHQRKYEKLVNIKKSMLDKMFPQNGASVPEIRFKSFTDPWEQRKLDEAFDFTVPNNTLSRAELNQESGSVRNVHYGDVLIKYGSVLDAQNDELPFITGRSKDDFKGALLQNGDIIIADTAEDETTGKVCEIVNIQDKDVVAGLHTMVCRPKNKTAEGYFGYYMNSSSYHHQLLPLMQGIKVLSLSKTNVQKTTVKYPKDKAEQQKIADCLRRIDTLITLHQRKLEKLQNIKKSCLEKMFV